MSPSMFDTDILSEFLRGNTKVVKNVDEYLKEFGIISLSIITYYEILNGLLYKDAKKQLKKFENFIVLNNVLLLTLKSTKLAANIQAELRKKGREIGHADTLIAGIAIANKLQFVINNTNHFKRIKGLEIANWSK
ncbi:type II toxin-antitoxin system VapC family toxin [Flavobacterium sp.]|uniref:type II toxin-antitoxin system VapC family toxin n=1 Tax=Flavobacterium sp. TaxID=239 RepID=UPI00374DEB89